MTAGHKYLCYFAHFNARGTVDSYVIHYIKALSDAGVVIRLISNSPIDEFGMQQLRTISSLISCDVRTNKGNDFGAWKYLLAHYEADADITDLLLTNDSVIGPLTPINSVFSTAEANVSYDFWGLTDAYLGGWHLQSFFLSLSRKVFTSSAFLDVFKLDFDHFEKSEIIKRGEIRLSAELTEAGFSGFALAPSALVDPGSEASASPLNNTHFFWRRLIEDFGFPFIKKELVLQNPENLNSVAELFEVTDHSSAFTSEDLRQFLVESCRRDPGKPQDTEIIALCHLFYRHSIYNFLYRLADLKAFKSKFLFNLSDELINDENFRSVLSQVFPDGVIMTATPVGRDIGGKLALLNLMSQLGLQSDLLLIIHDKTSPHTTQGVRWRQQLLELVTVPKVTSIINRFRSEPELGLVGPESQLKTDYDPDTGNFAGSSNDQIKDEISRLDLQVDNYLYIAGTVFWVRSRVFEKFFAESNPLVIRGRLERGNVLDFNKGTRVHAWERVFCFLVASAGFRVSGV